MKKKRIVIFVSLVLLLIAMPLTGAFAKKVKPIKLQYHFCFPRGAPCAPTVWWCEEVERRTKGAVKFDYLFGGPLGSLEEQALNIKGRVFDVGQTSCIYNPGLYPASTVAILPFLTDDFLAYARAAYDIMKHPAIQKEFKALNSVGLCPSLTEPMEMMSYVPARTIEDLKPLKIRGHGGSADALTAAGLTSVAVPWDELPSAAERRVVDAASMPVPVTARDYGYHDIFKYALRVPFYFFHFYLAINIDTWNELPPEIQKVMLDVAKEVPEKNVEIFEGLMEKAWADFTKAGVKEIKWSKDELERFRKIGGVPVWKTWVKDMEAKGIPGQEILDQFLELIAKHGG